jgi:hypothetical protein
MTFNVTMRTILRYENKKEIRDEVLLIYQDDRGVERRVKLAEKVQKLKRQRGTGAEGKWVVEDVEPDKAQVRAEMRAAHRGRDLARLPFFLRNQEDFDFHLLKRTLEEDHVIFKIAFRPRSPFKPLPSGTVYIDTNDFRVVHEEFTFEENPVPVLLKGVRRISRQWTELPGGQWVVSRIMGDFDLRGSWLGFIPDEVEVAVVFNDYRFDQGYDPRRFGPYEP